MAASSRSLCSELGYLGKEPSSHLLSKWDPVQHRTEVDTNKMAGQKCTGAALWVALRCQGYNGAFTAKCCHESFLHPLVALQPCKSCLYQKF
ncbi:hypothetical protein KC19_6G123600 [Ceratodon purpureus]|uniref:Uncharacterized protein n=1 Tax=Ceratodon purpureus TaxID=3225 RepID=A0A8T0HH34_CERPU|nr:hypothetical protein KC19_6G123600 [Ceratodon purpureus]